MSEGHPQREIGDSDLHALVVATRVYVREVVAGSFPTAEDRLQREAEIQRHARDYLEGWLAEHPGPVDQEMLLDVLRREFDEPAVLSQRLLAADSIRTPLDARCRSVLCGTIIAWGFVILALYAVSFFVQWRMPHHAQLATGAVSSLLLLLAPLSGLAGFLAYGFRSGNRYRVAPFVLVSTLAFALAAAGDASCEILERHPQPRYHVLISVTLPLLDADLEPLLFRSLVDLDRSGLPPAFTGSQFISFARSKAQPGAIMTFWLLVAGVALANHLIMRRIADDLWLLEDASA